MWVSAREVFLGAETEANETGRHYLHNFDEMNRHTPFKDPIYSSNLCLSGDTMIQVIKNGIHETVRLDTPGLAGTGYAVASRDLKTGKIVYRNITAHALMRRKAKVLKITDADTGKSVVCTPDHKVFTLNRGWVVAGDLKSDDSLDVIR